MTSFTVEFPGLGLSFDINRVAFTIFGVPIYWYGICIGLGMLLAVVIAFKLAPKYGIDTDRMIDVIFIGFVCAIIGGRLYYVLFVDYQYRNFFDLINLRLGGIAIYGAIIGAFIGAVIGCKWRKVPLLPMFDLTALGFLVGQGIGRWGNFFNQEAFGDNTRGVFGMISEGTTAYLQYNQDKLVAAGLFVDPLMPVHPTFLYESVWCLVGFAGLMIYQKHRRFNGEIFLLYVIWYGAGRAVIEGLRTDSLMIGPLRVSQALAVASALAALAIWIIARWKHKGQPLVIPEIPPHTAKVKIHDDKGPIVVTISWPAGERAPTREERLQLAQKVLEAEQTEQDGERGEDADDTTEPDENTAQADSPADDDAAQDEPAEEKPAKRRTVKAKPAGDEPKDDAPEDSADAAADDGDAADNASEAKPGAPKDDEDDG